jgi:hypothetical protein
MSMFINKVIGVSYIDPRAKQSAACRTVEPVTTAEGSAWTYPGHTEQIWPLHDAVREGDLKLVARILANELLDPNASDTFGQTALHIACSSYSVDTFLPIVVLLLNAGCQVHRRDNAGNSCIDGCATQLLKSILELHATRMSERKLTRAEVLLAHAFYRRHAMFHGFKVLIPTIAMKVQRQRHALHATGKTAAAVVKEEAKWQADNGDCLPGWEHWLPTGLPRRMEVPVVIEVARVDVRLPIGRLAVPWAERLAGKRQVAAHQSPVCRVRKLLTADQAVSIAAYLASNVILHGRPGTSEHPAPGVASELATLKAQLAKLQRQRQVLELQLNSLRKQGVGTIALGSPTVAIVPVRIGEVALAIGKAYSTALELRKHNIEVASRLLIRIEHLQSTSLVAKH